EVPPAPPGGMVRIPAGWFVRGNPAHAPDVGQDEAPQRLIYVDEFYLDRYPVTNAEYARFVRATGHRKPPNWQASYASEDQARRPVVYVDWEDAYAYAAWARKRLPTEAEWEKAARGGVWLEEGATDNPSPGRVFPWGNDFDRHRCATSESEGGG